MKLQSIHHRDMYYLWYYLSELTRKKLQMKAKTIPPTKVWVRMQYLWRPNYGMDSHQDSSPWYGRSEQEVVTSTDVSVTAIWNLSERSHRVHALLGSEKRIYLVSQIKIWPPLPQKERYEVVVPGSRGGFTSSLLGVPFTKFTRRREPRGLRHRSSVQVNRRSLSDRLDHPSKCPRKVKIARRR